VDAHARRNRLAARASAWFEGSKKTISPTEAAGDKIVITRHDQPVAHLPAAPQEKLPVRPLEEFRARVSPWSRPSSDLLREARDEGL
jgi:hypothetical protein